MLLPSITPKMVQDRMTWVWADANLSYRAGLHALARALISEYDYLSHYMSADQVYRILDRV